MAAAAKRGVQVVPVRLHLQTRQRFNQKHGGMKKLRVAGDHQLLTSTTTTNLPAPEAGARLDRYRRATPLHAPSSAFRPTIRTDCLARSTPHRVANWRIRATSAAAAPGRGYPAPDRSHAPPSIAAGGAPAHARTATAST